MILNARKDDAARCIELLNLAMEDIAFTLSGVSDPVKSDEILHKFFRSEINRLSYNNVFVFKFDGEIAGAICAYDGGETRMLDEPIRAHLQTLGLSEFPQTECFADELYIDSLAVDERFRGRGIAKELIKFIFTLASKRNIKKVALIVDEKKPKTMAFYERLGNDHKFSQILPYDKGDKMTKFKVANIHCENCANTIKNALEGDYGEIKVDLGVEPRVVSVNLDGKDEAKFKEELDDLGFSVIVKI